MKRTINKRTYQLSRRSFMRSSVAGASTVMALPLLEAMFDSEAAYAAAPWELPRLFAMYTPNGIIEEKWFPENGAKGNFDLTGTALEAFQTLGLKDEISLYRGLTNACKAEGSSGNQHLTGISSWLTGHGIQPHDGLRDSDMATKHRPSLDQEVAHHVLKALYPNKAEKDLPDADTRCLRMAGNSELDTGRMDYNNKQKNGLNWSMAGRILDFESDLRPQFNQMYGRGSDASGPSINDSYKRSVLDDVKQDTDRLLARLGAEDAQRMEAYMDNLRLIEQSLNVLEPDMPMACEPPIAVADVPSFPNGKRNPAIGDHMKVAAKLTAHAMSCGLIYGATYAVGGEAAGCQYSDLGINLHFHNNISHNRAGQYKNWVKIDKFHGDHCALFMDEMKKTPLGDGDCLDNTAVLFGSGMGNGDKHQTTDIAFMVGGRFGNWQHNRYHRLNGTNHAKVVDTVREELGLAPLGKGRVDIS